MKKLGLLFLFVFLFAAGAQADTQEKHQYSDPQLNDPERITVEQVKERLDRRLEVVIVDARNLETRTNAVQVVPGAIHVSGNGQFKELIAKVSKESFIVAYCT